MPKSQTHCPILLLPQNLAYFGLLLLLVILLVQSSIALFHPVPAGSDLSGIDVVIRTALSSIFGFIMSMVGNQSSSTSQSQQTKTNQTTSSAIGFQSDTTTKISPQSTLRCQSTSDSDTPTPVQPQTRTTSPLRRFASSQAGIQLQICIVTAICLYCLSVIMVLRDSGTDLATNSASISTITQYRDFVSGGIGALIGLSRSGTGGASSHER